MRTPYDIIGREQRMGCKAADSRRPSAVNVRRQGESLSHRLGQDTPQEQSAVARPLTDLTKKDQDFK